MLRDFSWCYFASTGDIHAYLLYREHCELLQAADDGLIDPPRDELGDQQVCL